MKKMIKLRLTIALLMLAAAACVLLGKTTIGGPGFSLTYNYIDALFPTPDSSWRENAIVYAWILFASGIAAAGLVWIKGAWAALVTCAVCVSSLVYHVIRSVENKYGVFQIDGVWEFFMLALPLVAAILCVALFKAIRDK